MKTKLNRVLIIDDDEPTNYFNQMIVETAGCAESIHGVYSGEEALDYLTNKQSCGDGSGEYPKPDLIFLDINMPAMNGWEFLVKYKELSPKYKGNVIIVMLTTSLFPDDMEKAAELPEIAGFENKPLTFDKIQRIMDSKFTRV